MSANPDLKLIRHNMGGVDLPDDPSFGPWRLDMSFRVPGFMEVAAAFIYGTEQIVVRSKTKEALEKFASNNNFQKHPRLIKIEITQPEAKEEHKEFIAHDSAEWNDRYGRYTHVPSGDTLICQAWMNQLEWDKAQLVWLSKYAGSLVVHKQLYVGPYHETGDTHGTVAEIVERLKARIPEDRPAIPTLA